MIPTSRCTSRGDEKGEPGTGERDDRDGHERGRSKEDRRDSRRDDEAGEDDPDFKVYIEGPNQTHCYRATVEMTKPDKSAAGGGRAGTKMRVTAAWQGDKKTAQRDLGELRKAWKDGGFDAVYKRKTELRDKAVGRR